MNVAPNGTKVGYIRLKQFNANAAKDMRNAITELVVKSSGFVCCNNPAACDGGVEIARR